MGFNSAFKGLSMTHVYAECVRHVIHVTGSAQPARIYAFSSS